MFTATMRKCIIHETCCCSDTEPEVVEKDDREGQWRIVPAAGKAQIGNAFPSRVGEVQQPVTMVLGNTTPLVSSNAPFPRNRRRMRQTIHAGSFVFIFARLMITRSWLIGCVAMMSHK